MTIVETKALIYLIPRYDQRVRSDSQALVDAQLALAGRTGVFRVSEPIHAEGDEAASQHEPGEDGSRRQAHGGVGGGF